MIAFVLTMAKGFDNMLNEMTKAELIAWIKECSLARPSKKWLLFKRWDIRSRAVLDEQDAHIKLSPKLNLKKRDEHARLFNASSDQEEKFRLANLIAPYDIKISAYIEEGKRIDKKQQAVDKLYAQYDMEE